MQKTRSVEERIRLYEDWAQSGLKKTEFCILNKLSRSNYKNISEKIFCQKEFFVLKCTGAKSMVAMV